LRADPPVEMVDQRRSQTSAYQPKYDTYAKPVLLSQPEKQRASFHLGSDSPESVDGSNHGARKAAPGKLDLSKIDSLSQGDLSAALAPAVALRPSRGPSQNFGTGADTDNTEKGSLRSPGRQDLPNGTPLSRHPSDALSRKASPKALLDGDGIAQGQITIVAEARLITSSVCLKNFLCPSQQLFPHAVQILLMKLGVGATSVTSIV
jgi:hypothetical protein